MYLIPIFASLLYPTIISSVIRRATKKKGDPKDMQGAALNKEHKL